VWVSLDCRQFIHHTTMIENILSIIVFSIIIFLVLGVIILMIVALWFLMFFTEYLYRKIYL